MKKFILLTLIFCLILSLPACGGKGYGDTSGPAAKGPVNIRLDDAGITVNGVPVGEDPKAGVYTAHDIVYYESGRGPLYGEGTARDEHPAAEAAAHTVLHITAPGVYILSGRLSAGQIAVDLGEGARDDPTAVVELILAGVDITCTVAPAILFYNVYECDRGAVPSPTVDTSGAGANLRIRDGTDNTVTGSYVARIYASVEQDGQGKITDSKKLHKYDGAVYSKMSMNVFGGDGRLTINAENEGLDTERHLTINGGVLNIFSGNDGINANQDGVSVITVNGGDLAVVSNGGYGGGDGIDSNGWLVINWGTVRAFACSASQDAGLDASLGLLLNGGQVAATGSMPVAAAPESHQRSVAFALPQGEPGAYSVRDGAGAEILPVRAQNAFSHLTVSSPRLDDGQYRLYLGETPLAAAHCGVGEPPDTAPDTTTPPPLDPPPEVPDDALVKITDYIPGLFVDLRYATENNFTGQIVYDFTEPYLRYGTVKKLALVQEALLEQGYSLMIWDALRPVSAQFALWEICPDSRYITDPNKGFSNHSRGNTVDVTLVRADGSPVPMPSDFDTFTALADRDYSDVSPQAEENAKLLEAAMAAQGFKPYQAEWWHYTDNVTYGVVK